MNTNTWTQVSRLNSDVIFRRRVKQQQLAEHLMSLETSSDQSLHKEPTLPDNNHQADQADLKTQRAIQRQLLLQRYQQSESVEQLSEQMAITPLDHSTIVVTKGDLNIEKLYQHLNTVTHQLQCLQNLNQELLEAWRNNAPIADSIEKISLHLQL